MSIGLRRAVRPWWNDAGNRIMVVWLLVMGMSVCVGWIALKLDRADRTLIWSAGFKFNMVLVPVCGAFLTRARRTSAISCASFVGAIALAISFLFLSTATTGFSALFSTSIQLFELIAVVVVALFGLLALLLMGVPAGLLLRSWCPRAEGTRPWGWPARCS